MISTFFDALYCRIKYGTKWQDYEQFEFYKKSPYFRKQYLLANDVIKLDHWLKSTLAHPISDNKIQEYRLYHNFINRSWIEVSKNSNFFEVEDFVKKNNQVIAKPNFGAHGHGVFVIKDGDVDSMKKLKKLSKSVEYVVEEIESNCDEINAINSTSLNTIRCYTLIEKSGNIRIMEVFLRAGVEGQIVDNWGAGGVSYRFDVKTGVCIQPGKDKFGKQYVLHPGTNFQMVGFKIPMYDQLLDYITELCGIEPSAKYVGWDIAITPKGFDLIEMNCPGGHYLLQLFDNPWGDIIKNNINFR